MTVPMFTQDALAQRIQGLRGYVEHLEHLIDGLDDGGAEWWDWSPDMAGLDKPNRAAEEAAQALEDARKELGELTGGTR